MNHPIWKAGIATGLALVAWAGVSILDSSKVNTAQEEKLEILMLMPGKVDTIIDSVNTIKVDLARIEERTRLQAELQRAEREAAEGTR